MPATPDYMDLLGIPFERGARGPHSYDCYGLVREMFRRAGVEVPDFVSPGTVEHIEALINHACKSWKKVPIGTVGALITFRVDGAGAHVGYMLPGDRFIHAIEPEGVTTERLTNNPRLRAVASYIYE